MVVELPADSEHAERTFDDFTRPGPESARFYWASFLQRDPGATRMDTACRSTQGAHQNTGGRLAGPVGPDVRRSSDLQLFVHVLFLPADTGG